MVNPNCSSGFWLEDTIVLPAVKSGLIAFHKIDPTDDVDVTKNLSDYGVAGATFFQLCDWLAGKDDGGPIGGKPGKINEALEEHHCAQRLLLKPAWRIAHQNDGIGVFVEGIIAVLVAPAAVADV